MTNIKSLIFLIALGITLPISLSVTIYTVIKISAKILNIGY